MSKNGQTFNRIERQLELIIAEINKTSSFDLEKTAVGVRHIAGEAKIILYGQDKDNNEVFIKFPFPLDKRINKRQAERVHYLQKKIGENKKLFRLARTEPLEIAGLKAVVTEKGIMSLKDVLDDENFAKKEKIETAYVAITHSIRGMEILHNYQILVCDFKDSNVVRFSDGEWMIVDSESFKPINADFYDESVIAKGYFSSSGRTTENYLDWNVNKDELKLTELSDRFGPGATLFKAYFGHTPEVILALENKNKKEKEKEEAIEFILRKIEEVKNPVHKYFMQRTMGEVLNNNILPTERKYFEFRFNHTEEARQILEKNEVIYFEKDLEHPDYQEFLRSAQEFKTAVTEASKKPTGLEGTLSLEGADKIRSTYHNFLTWYANESVHPIPQSQEVKEEIETIRETVIQDESAKLKEYLQANRKKLENKKIAGPLWEIFSKSMILGLNENEEMYSLQDIKNPKEEYINSTKSLIDRIKRI